MRVTKKQVVKAAADYQSAQALYGETNLTTVRAEIRYREIQTQYE